MIYETEYHGSVGKNRTTSNSSLEVLNDWNKSESSGPEEQTFTTSPFEDVENEVCRVCLMDGSLPILPDLSNCLKLITGIKVQEDDSLPQHLCTTCRETLDTAMAFRSLAQRSNEILHKKGDESQEEMSENKESMQDEVDSDSGSVYLEYAESEESQCTSEYREDTIADHVEEEILVADITKTKFPACEICHATFRTAEQVEEHSLIHKNAMICEVCQNIIPKVAHETHLHIHRVNMRQRQNQIIEKVECVVCKKLVKENYLKTHMSLHHKERSVNCPICDKTLKKESLPKHMQIMHTKKRNEEPSKKMMCPICSKMFDEQNYKSHVASHGRKKVYVCDECGKELATQSSYSTHILTHKNEFKFKCDYCPYRGKHRGLLRVHISTHTKAYVHKCKICNANFITKSNLTAHEKTHSSSVRFICSECGKGYSSEDTLRQHKVSVHDGIKAFSCELCPKRYGSRDSLAVHMKRIHKVFKNRYGNRACFYSLEVNDK